ncbi:MAG: hypothetical protein CSA54_00100, partial [Gammaproteobacteria bacterium]
MNFLAHTRFAFSRPALIAGQVAGDFVRGSDLSAFSERVRQGIRLHRRLDAWTDRHPIIGELRPHFVEPRRRFAGIIIDVLFDHWLARHWDAISDDSLEQHAALVDAALLAHRNELPADARRFTRVLHERGILVGNRELAHIALTLERLASRSAAFASLAVPASRLEELVALTEGPFEAFFPEAEETAATLLA